MWGSGLGHQDSPCPLAEVSNGKQHGRMISHYHLDLGSHHGSRCRNHDRSPGRTPTRSWLRLVPLMRGSSKPSLPFCASDFWTLGPGLPTRATWPDADPVYLCTNVLTGIVPERGLNNGMPSYRAPLNFQRQGVPRRTCGPCRCRAGLLCAILVHLVGDAGKIPREWGHSVVEHLTAAGH